jgi:hypothetical protein
MVRLSRRRLHWHRHAHDQPDRHVKPVTVRPTAADRLIYGTVVPFCVAVVVVLVSLLDRPPDLVAAVALYGFVGLMITASAAMAATAWRASLTVREDGLVIHGGLRELRISWGEVERIAVGRPHAYAGRKGRTSGRWRALHVHVAGEPLPVIVAATNRRRAAMSRLVADVEPALAPHQLRIDVEARH